MRKFSDFVLKSNLALEKKQPDKVNRPPVNMQLRREKKRTQTMFKAGCNEIWFVTIVGKVQGSETMQKKRC